MTPNYIASWLMDEIANSPEKFPPDHEIIFDSIVDDLDSNFDDQIVNDHLDDLLTKILTRQLIK